MSKSAAAKNARKTALAILNRITMDQSYANILLKTTLAKLEELTPRDKALVTELVYGTLRWQGKIDWLLSQYCQRSLSKLSPNLLNILRLGTYQLLWLKKVPAYAAVDEAVRLARNKAGFVNGVLRAVARSRGEVSYPYIEKDPVNHIANFYSQPIWLIKILLEQHGLKKTIELAEALNQRPPLTLRANSLKIDRGELLAQLKKEVREARLTEFSPEGIIVSGSAELESLPSYQKGRFVVQDEAAQLVTQILAPASGEKVLDACAAPGGKATHAAQLMGNKGLILALDLSQKKLALAAKECRRLGISIIRFLVADSTRPLPSRMEFDRIMLDAPCSGTGVIRRHPEGKWQEPELSHLVQLQRRLLNNLAPYLAPGGTLVYSVCSLLYQEGEEVVACFLKESKEFRLDGFCPKEVRAALIVSGGKGSYRTDPASLKMDGFYIAKMIKVKGVLK